MRKAVLYSLGFLIKGWEVSLLLILPILQTQGKINIYTLGILAATFSAFQIVASLSAGLFGIASVFYLSAFVAVGTLLPLYLYQKSK